jgi:predicted Holliday junction resolvase-like endonuclease
MTETGALIITFSAAALIAVFTALYLAYRLGRSLGRRAEERDWIDNKLDAIIRDRIKRSRAVLGGQFSEQLSPYFPDFPFIGKPVDFLVFRGMDEGEVEEIAFVEVKSGSARNLSKIERQLRDAVREGRVSWMQYNVPEDITSVKKNSLWRNK